VSANASASVASAPGPTRTQSPGSVSTAPATGSQSSANSSSVAVVASRRAGVSSSRCRMTAPAAVRGIAGTVKISTGTATGGSCARHRARRVVASGSPTTYATAVAPRSSCGRPATAASVTPSIPASTASARSGRTRSSPTRMTSASLPVTVR
jgi:hypothetical protein